MIGGWTESWRQYARERFDASNVLTLQVEPSTGSPPARDVALAITQGMRVLLFGVAPTDRVTYAAVAGVVSVAVLAASCLPAFRAASANPIDVLKRE